MNQVYPSLQKFLIIGSLVFSGTKNGVRGPYGVMAELDPLKKILLLSKMGKIGKA